MTSSWRTLRIWLVLVFAILSFVLAIPADAQTKTATQTRRDVEVTIQKNGDVQVSETWEFRFTGGPFTFATRGIALNKVEAITDMSVSEGGRAYQLTPSGSTAGTYQVYREGNYQVIKWYYTPAMNQTRTFTIRYTLRGALRIYDGGDQFWWQIIEADRGYTINTANITVRLPASFPLDQLKAAVTLGNGIATIRDGQTIVFTANNLRDGEGLEVRVQFPHGVVTAAPPSWQAAADAEAAAQAERERYKPLFNLLALFGGLVLLVLGLLGVFLLWYLRGRDVQVPQIAQMNTPPSDLPAGMVGTLIDEKAEMKDIIATIIDLARRGIIRMSEKEEPGFLGIGTKRDFVFELVGDTTNLRPYEQTLIQRLFGGSTTRALSDLKQKFYTAIPTLQKQMYEEVSKLGFFAGNPNTTRAKYAGLGIVALIVFGCCGVLFYGFAVDYADLAFCPPAALVITAVGLIVIGPFMPRRTKAGALEKAKWEAFKRYLASIEKFTQLEQAQELFDKYLPYAIVFGLEKSWTQKFAAVGTPAPMWYETYPPTGYGIPRPRRALSDEPAIGSSGGGVPSSGGSPLDRAAAGTFRGLDAMSAGLFSMLDSTASILSSAPSSSGSSGGWSGGGGRGGGGGGGGFSRVG